MHFPKEIEDIVRNISYVKDDIGRSEDEVFIYEDKYILKISSDPKRLFREKQKTDWISSRIPGSISITYVEEDSKCYYLRTCVKGDSLIANRFINNPLLMIEVLTDVVKILRELDSSKCPFVSTDNVGNDFVHGDLCLPNIYVNEKNEFVGFIDLDNSGLGDKWYDYSWLLWSLEYNLKTNKYNDLLLEKIGIEMKLDKFYSYIPQDYLKGLKQ